MYYYKQHGKQCVDFRGDFILTHNTDLMMARAKSAAPRVAKNARWIPGVSGLSWWNKVVATCKVIRFIWGPDTSLQQATIDAEGL